MKRVTLLLIAALAMTACKKDKKAEETAQPTDSTAAKAVRLDAPIDCQVSMTNMYDAQGRIADKSISIILPQLKAGKQYNIQAMYNVSADGQNRVLIHLTDTQNTLPQSSVETTVNLPFELSAIKNTPGSDPIDPEKKICIGIFHENYQRYFGLIQEHAAHIYAATQNRTACDGMTYEQLFENTVHEDNAEARGPKKCGSGMAD